MTTNPPNRSEGEKVFNLALEWGGRSSDYISCINNALAAARREAVTEFTDRILKVYDNMEFGSYEGITWSGWKAVRNTLVDNSAEFLDEKGEE